MTKIVKKAFNFISLLAIVISSQIGAGALSIPTIFAPLGYSGIAAWFTIIMVVLILAYIFAQLAIALPYTGGPHVYIKHTMNDTMAFFAGWLYWMVSWISTTVILIECSLYLNQALPMSVGVSTLVGVAIWTIFNYLNYQGVGQAAFIELVLTIIKVCFFIFFIILSCVFFNADNILQAPLNMISYKAGLAAAMWCFIGIETATIPAEIVEDPRNSIPKATILGTVITSIMYILSVIGVMGLVHHTTLAQNGAPYSLIVQQFFGNKAQICLSILVFLIFAGSLNAWILISGQISAGLAKDGLLPKKFSELHNDVPYFGLLISYIGVSAIWIIGSYFSLISQLSWLIDATVPVFIIIYMLCCISYMQLYKTYVSKILGTIGVLACMIILINTEFYKWIAIIILTVLGIPIWLSIKKY